MTLGYYTFGLKQKGYNNVITGGNDLAQQWKFGGNEYNQELGLNWYDVSARNYDPALGRWMNLDPLELIEDIVFDPRIEYSEFKRHKKNLMEFKFDKKIVKSKLYDMPEFKITPRF